MNLNCFGDTSALVEPSKVLGSKCSPQKVVTHPWGWQPGLKTNLAYSPRLRSLRRSFITTTGKPLGDPHLVSGAQKVWKQGKYPGAGGVTTFSLFLLGQPISTGGNSLRKTRTCGGPFGNHKDIISDEGLLTQGNTKMS